MLKDLPPPQSTCVNCLAAATCPVTYANRQPLSQPFLLSRAADCVCSDANAICIQPHGGCSKLLIPVQCGGYIESVLMLVMPLSQRQFHGEGLTADHPCSIFITHTDKRKEPTSLAPLQNLNRQRHRYT